VAEMPVERCEDCGYVTPYEVVLCPRCGSTAVKKDVVSGEGEVYTFTKIRVPPEGFEQEGPYTVLAVRLVEGTLIPARWAEQEEPFIGQEVAYLQTTPKGPVFGARRAQS